MQSIDINNKVFLCLNKKEFWAFFGRKTKGKMKGVLALRNSAGVSVTIIIVQRESLRHFQTHLGT